MIGGLIVVVVLTWLFWRPGEPSRLPKEAATPSAQPPSEAASNRSPRGAEVPDPRGQATALKREAVVVAREVVEAYPDDAISYALLGSAYYNIGQSTEATESLRRCIELDPGQGDAYEILARVAYEKGELEEAVRLGKEGLSRAPANGQLLNRLGRALLDLGRTEEAVPVLRQALEMPGYTSETHYLLGQAYLQSGDYAHAKESFQRAIALLPDHTQAFFGLFTACTRLGETEEAARYREQFLKLEAIDRQALTDRSAQEDTLTGLPLVRGTVARTLFGAGQIYRMHGRDGKATELFLRVAALDADNAFARAELETLYARREALPEGLEAFGRLVNDQPECGLNHLFLGRLQVRLQHFDAAEAAFRKVQELAPDRPEGYRALAELYLRSDRRPAEAMALAKRVLALEPSAPNYYLLAFACAKNNDRAGAVAAMEKAVSLSPGNTRYQEFLQQLREGH